MTRRTIEGTFDMGWKLLGLLPKSELTRIKREVVDQYYVEYTDMGEIDKAAPIKIENA